MPVRRTANELLSARPIKICGHYCELFTCRDSFAILALDYTTSLNEFVLCSVIKNFRNRHHRFATAKIKNVGLAKTKTSLFRDISLTLCAPSIHVILANIPVLSF